MRDSVTYYGLLIATAVIYFGISKYIFDKVNSTTHIVVDELFHIPQGLAYCHRNFTYWDPKITTLPGLYLISSAVLGNYFECNTYNLRFINLVASCLNLLLFSSILKFIYGGANESNLKIVLQALNLTILPPLYFFSHVYYTDTLSLTFLLAFVRLCFVHRYKFNILMLGVVNVVMRQSNIVWVALVFGHKILDVFVRSSRVFGNKDISNVTLAPNSVIAEDVDKSKLRRYYGFYDFMQAVKYHFRTYFRTFFKFITLQDWIILLIHGTVLVTFSIFVYVNGSIVIGDKNAHKATLHLPQLFYFLIFYGIFGLPYVISNFFSTLHIIIRNKINIMLLTLLFLAIVHFNTIVHPYLLADNRHYTFYVWNRWFGKYDFAVYVSVIAYVFLLASLYDNLKDQNCITFLLPYTVCAITVLGLQKMIEIRYFLIPYIILRLRFGKSSIRIVLMELMWYLAINFFTFQLFFTKQFMWKDFDYAQRIIW